MSTDRELLELAAKAAEIQVRFDFRGEPFMSGGWQWTPLTDDGDALRLAVKLSLTMGQTLVGEDHIRYFVASRMYVYEREPLGDDPCAAARRSIVRAAAEIGKRML